jgi:transcriptional regulator with XRE-family HTH domain
MQLACEFADATSILAIVRFSLGSLVMSEPDPKTTLREFHEYSARSYEPSHTIAERIGVAKVTIWDWFAGRRQPKALSLAKLRRFLDAEAKRPLQGDGIRPAERSTVQNHQTHSASAIRPDLSVLPQGAGQDP